MSSQNTIISNPQFYTPLSELRQYSDKYLAEAIKWEPLYKGWTVYGDATLYECHIRGDENTIVMVIGGKAYDTGHWEISDLREHEPLQVNFF
jgi:hypothetical protein|tara:strand:+ start:632 stop:907 length:276 start_codon:yes stop_codon:yes gene_type:complete